MSELSSSRGLIKSMLVIGSAQVVNILISIVRMKVLAVLLGPSGVGLLSIYNSLLGMVNKPQASAWIQRRSRNRVLAR